jgi:hypothetical protein
MAASWLRALMWVSLAVAGCSGKTTDTGPAGSCNGSECADAGSTSCKDGDSRPAPDGCNTCTCSSGEWACTEKACPAPPCIDGASICSPCKDGETMQADCNTCTCSRGQWQCTLIACEPAGKGCGGFLGMTCAADEYCAYQPGEYCGAADASSTCKKRPSGCTKESDPVCGCDQKTYGNACAAAAAGTGIYERGQCNFR